ncbi:MAG: histidinol-phosphate transaminase [Cyclobacteriaceae bacterium]|nr:histidinol-phosphate transaminase [Cyclobacteriaceae bacterium HetDA_MAG_MS6]
MELVERLIRGHLKHLEPYSSARDEYTGTKGVFLDANENPHGSVAGDKWNRYPDPYQRSLKLAVSGIKGVPTENLFIGNGSDEPIDLLIRAFCEPSEDHILVFPPTYKMYEVSASIQNVQVKKIQLTDDFQLDVRTAKGVTDEHTKLTFICSPNNPTGNKMRMRDITDILESSKGLVVVDEAYIDFAPDLSFSKRLEEYENLVVLQTFSKAWGMAAFRLGVAYAHAEVIKVLNMIKAPYNISGPIQQQALTAFLNFQKKNDWVTMVAEEREKIIPGIEGMSIVKKVFPSEANFLLVQFHESEPVFNHLISNQVIVRDRSSEAKCENCLRITIGTRDENERLLFLLQSLSDH